MESHLYRIGVTIVAVVALQRAVAIHYFFVRRFWSYRKRAEATPTSWRDLITYPEPPLLLVVTLFLWLTQSNPADPSAPQLVRVVVAAILALGALVLQVWALRSLPGVSPGHYVLPEQQVVTAGPYGLVRHPLYLEAILVWLSLAIGFASPVVLLASLLYVIPAYVIFGRAEEKMMLEHVGESYGVYRENVGGFLPRSRRPSSDHHDPT